MQTRGKHPVYREIRCNKRKKADLVKPQRSFAINKNTQRDDTVPQSMKTELTKPVKSQAVIGYFTG